MPFKSEAQRRFMFSQHPEIAKEFQAATPKDAHLPEHVKKMDEGGRVNGASDDTAALADKDIKVSPMLARPMAEGGTSAGNPAKLDPPIQDATVSDFLLPYLLGPSEKTMGEMAESVGPKLADEAGALFPKASEQLAPKMEEDILGATTKDIPQEAKNIEVYSKGIQKDAHGNPVTHILGVKGDPAILKTVLGDEAPGSVPENVLRAKGIPIPMHLQLPPQMADGGVIDKIKSLIKTDKTDAQQADNIDPVVSSSSTVQSPPSDPTKMNSGGVWLQNEPVATVNKVTHVQGKQPTEDATSMTGTKHGYSKMAKGGIVDKQREVYKAMGIKKYADGGNVDTSQLPNPTPSSTDPTYWDQIKATLAAVGAPFKNAANVVAPPTLTQGAADIAASPAVPAITNAALGTNLPVPPSPTIPPVAPTMTPAARTPVPTAPITPQPVSGPSSATGMPSIAGIFNQDTSKLTQGVNAEDRQALANQMQERQHSLGSIIAEAVSGLGDALAAKGGRDQHSLQNIFSMQKDQRMETLANFDKARQDRIQKLTLQTQMGDNALKQAAAADAYGVDDHLNSMIGAPKGTMKKDLPTYFSLMSAQVAKQEKQADLYMKAHAQASSDVDNAIKNASMLGIKPSSDQLLRMGQMRADQYINRANGNLQIKLSDGSEHWLPSQNLNAAKQRDPGLQVIDSSF